MRGVLVGFGSLLALAAFVGAFEVAIRMQAVLRWRFSQSADDRVGVAPRCRRATRLCDTRLRDHLRTALPVRLTANEPTELHPRTPPRSGTRHPHRSPLHVHRS